MGSNQHLQALFQKCSFASALQIPKESPKTYQEAAKVYQELVTCQQKAEHLEENTARAIKPSNMINNGNHRKILRWFNTGSVTGDEIWPRHDGVQSFFQFQPY